MGSRPVGQAAGMTDGPKVGADFLSDLPMPDVATWPIFPFWGFILPNRSEAEQAACDRSIAAQLAAY